MLQSPVPLLPPPSHMLVHCFPLKVDQTHFAQGYGDSTLHTKDAAWSRGIEGAGGACVRRTSVDTMLEVGVQVFGED